MEATTSPLLSIVTTTYSVKKLKDIFELLDSISAQTYPNIEIIFVADQLEELKAKVEEYAQKHSKMKVEILLNHGEAGVNISRNIGIKGASGEIIGIVDDDVILSPDWAEEVVRTYMEDSSVVAVTGPAIPLWEDESMGWFPREFYWVWGCTVWDWNEIREIRNVGGMNCSFKREALFAAGLYRPNIGPRGGEEIIKWFYPSGEEVELSLRIRAATGKRIVYNPKVKVHHKVAKVRFNLGFMIKRAFRFGYTKQFIKHTFQNDFPNEKVLGMEFQHLRHILFKSTLDLMRRTFENPVTAWRQLLVTIIGVFFTGLGYAVYILKPYKLQQVQRKE